MTSAAWPGVEHLGCSTLDMDGAPLRNRRDEHAITDPQRVDPGCLRLRCVRGRQLADATGERVAQAAGHSYDWMESCSHVLAF